jgi:toxin ParE1/3/4
VRVDWLPEAARTFSQAVASIADDDPQAAIAIGDAIIEAIDRLARFPRMARLGRLPGTRELAVTGTPYVVVYRLGVEAVVVLRVLHGAQRWPPGPPAPELPPPGS